MTIKKTATEFKAEFLSLLDDVAAGHVVVITENGQTVARLVSAAGPHPLRGSLVGLAITGRGEKDLFATGAWGRSVPRR